MLQRGFFLLITHDDQLVRIVSEPVQRYSVLRRARGEGEALSLLRPNAQWSGAMLDLAEGEADALGLTRRLRAAAPRLPLLALVSHATAELVNGMQGARVELVVRPVAELNLVSFVQRALVSAWVPDDRLAAWVDERARTLRLTPREVQLTAYAFGDETRGCVMRRLGISENTLKTQIRGLLRKFGVRSLDHLARLALRETLIYESHTNADGIEASPSATTATTGDCVPAIASMLSCRRAGV